MTLCKEGSHNIRKFSRWFCIGYGVTDCVFLGKRDCITEHLVSQGSSETRQVAWEYSPSDVYKPCIGSPGSLFLTCATFEPYLWKKWFTVVSDAFLWQFGESRFSNKYRQKMIWLLNKNVQNCHFSILFIYQIHRNNLLSSESLIKYLINIGSFNKE